jgi:hypothetical protein
MWIFKRLEGANWFSIQLGRRLLLRSAAPPEKEKLDRHEDLATKSLCGARFGIPEFINKKKVGI